METGKTWQFRSVIEPQFGAAIDTLEQVIRACPDALWAEKGRGHEFWYDAFHTLFWLDYYLSGSSEGFVPPPPFGMEEADPAGVMPPRVYTKDELLAYLAHGRGRFAAAMDAFSDDVALERCGIERLDLNQAEFLIYQTRHVQHHAAQLNLLLRQATDSATRWVRRGATRA